MIVLLPGLDGTGDLLEPFAAAAPPETECLVVRYPTDRVLDYDALVALVTEQLPRDREVTLVGESFSGPVAVRLAHHASLLVLVSSFVTPPLPRVLRLFARSSVFRLRLPDAILARLMLAPLATPELTARFASTIERVEPRVLAARVRELLRVDVAEALARVACPVLYLRGEHDRLVPERAVRDVLRARPSTRVHRLPAPHAILQAAPALAWAALTAPPLPAPAESPRPD